MWQTNQDVDKDDFGARTKVAGLDAYQTEEIIMKSQLCTTDYLECWRWKVYTDRLWINQVRIDHKDLRIYLFLESLWYNLFYCLEEEIEDDIRSLILKNTIS